LLQTPVAYGSQAGTLRAIVNPLRGLAADAAYVSSAIAQVPGPVLAVGHYYGGAVITNAAGRNPNVQGLVYVAAFAPDEGETVGDRVGASKDSLLLPAVLEAKYPTGHGDETAPELYVDPARFHEVFAADLPQQQPDAVAAVILQAFSTLS
jgi:pimeloyl-ACP methyl ester carboxylesterase